MSPDRPLKLLQVLGGAGFHGLHCGITGVERVVQQLLEGLDPRRFEHYLVYPDTGLLLETYARQTRDILRLEPRRRFDREYVDAVARCIDAHAIDLVLSHGLRYDFLTALACRRTRVPHVVVRAVALADETMSAQRKLLYGIFDAWTLRQSRNVIAVSEASRRRMLRTQALPPQKVAVIPNGVVPARASADERRAARHALGIDAETRLVGGAGQLIARKSFAMLVEALSLVGNHSAPVVCVLLGEGPERAPLERLARERGVRLLLPGYRADARALMAGFDIAVLPSRAEGMPLVVLESMTQGVPTVATAVAGSVEVIEHGRSGLLVEPGKPVALAAALRSLLDDPELRARMGTAGAERIATHFSLDRMLQSFSEHLLRAAGWTPP